MKTLYICGDSFAVADKECEIIPWFELLANSLGSNWTVVNQSIVCASNLHIRLQVQSAIDNRANFVILLSTSSARGEGRLYDRLDTHGHILDRFVNIGVSQSKQKEFGCYSYNSLDETCMFEPQQVESLKNFRDDIFDLELAIYNNQFIIESGLHALQNSSIPFVFDQGGFEHPKFSGSKQQYFKSFANYRSEFNLWSYVKHPMSHRPYFHITDQSIHHSIAEYYFSKINHYG